MKTSTIILVSIALVATVILGSFFLRGGVTQQTQQGQVQNSQSDGGTGVISPHYVWYSPQELAKAQEKGRAVIYFWAGWCPTCKALNQELIQRSKELPEDVTVLKINYDQELDLKKKYHIVTQHTLVLVDKNGNEVKQWTGGNVDVIKEQLQ
ncbi:thioredoxin family protein [Candidatus Gottesmanbacteria bacterium]|nr:thioredoxin family protein [Candidatus Gottesmanbacteria bacterium]